MCTTTTILYCYEREDHRQHSTTAAVTRVPCALLRGLAAAVATSASAAAVAVAEAADDYNVVILLAGRGGVYSAHNTYNTNIIMIL